MSTYYYVELRKDGNAVRSEICNTPAEAKKEINHLMGYLSAAPDLEIRVEIRRRRL